MEGKETDLASALVEQAPLSVSLGDEKDSTSHKVFGIISGAPGSFYLVSPVGSLESSKVNSHGKKVDSKP